MRDPSISGRPPGEPGPAQRGYNSFVPLEPMNQLQVDLASPTPTRSPESGRALREHHRGKEARYHAGGAELALRNIERRAKHKVTRPEIKVGDMVRNRVNAIAWKGIQGCLRRERGDGLLVLALAALYGCP